MESKTNKQQQQKKVFRVSYLVDRLLALFVLLCLLLHLLTLFNVIDEREEITQVNDERLRLDDSREMDEDTRKLDEYIHHIQANE